jgi:3-phosphoshikimate 1-carboxyvinyltransferase
VRILLKLDEYFILNTLLITELTMTIIKINAPDHAIQSHISLPFSKSECNRALIIQALAKYQSGGEIELSNISQARDSQTMQRLLRSPEVDTWDVLDAGTTMRFLTAYAAITQQNKHLTGTDRMCERPIGILADALKELGFKISYAVKEGFPPLVIQAQDNFKPTSKEIKIRGDVSSQFISALLMIAPLLPEGLVLELTGKIGSRPYIDMTLSQMKHFGIEHEWKENKIEILPQIYQAVPFAVEADWSAASYWYSIVALAPKAEVTLLGLKPSSQQGDSHIQVLMKGFGVKTKFIQEGIILSKEPHFIPISQKIDFTACPDLAQTIFVVAAALKVPLRAAGLESLRIKETDRIQALQNELAKIGVELRENNNTWDLRFDEWANVPTAQPTETLSVKTYHDHRMAMAFAPLALRQSIVIENPKVVNKSYPSFWEDLEKVGFYSERLESNP